MKRKKAGPSGIPDIPLQRTSQAKAAEAGIASVREGRLKLYDERADNVRRFLDLIKERITRPVAASMVGCVHCGLCARSCHYALTRPDDPTMTPVYKADQIRRVFKKHLDWTGRIVPWWVHARVPAGDEDLVRLKNIVFGTCSMCRRCSFNCPMGVDTAVLIRWTRGILTELGIVPEGVFTVNRDQWETGNQMGVSDRDYLETLDWMADELRTEPGMSGAVVPVDRPDCDFLYVINPRVIKFDPRSIAHAAKVFHAAGESWTMASLGWDMTSFGLFSGDDRLGARIAGAVYEAADRLRARRGIPIRSLSTIPATSPAPGGSSASRAASCGPSARTSGRWSPTEPRIIAARVGADCCPRRSIVPSGSRSPGSRPISFGRPAPSSPARCATIVSTA
ncbi:MAG: (Fe-S)-binding protein [Candidatus Aminicenantes bacterium]|nr:(Fe-S)-binding protein [Candidatus Aminicenantes bacterium]